MFTGCAVVMLWNGNSYFILALERSPVLYFRMLEV